MKRKLIAIAILVTLTLPGCGGYMTRVANIDLNMGTNALNKGDYARAEKKLKEAVYEGHLDRIGIGWNNLAYLYEKTGRQTEATNAYTMGARYGELLAAVALNRWNQTIPSPDLVATTPPVPIGYKPGQIYFQDGVVAFNAGDWVEAEKQFRLAVITGQELASSWNNLGAVYSRVNHKELARFSFEMGAHYGSPVSEKNLVAMGKPVPSHDLMTREQKDTKAAQDKAYADARRAQEERQAAADATQFASNAGDVLLFLLGAAALGAGAYYSGKVNAGAPPSTTVIVNNPPPKSVTVTAPPRPINCTSFVNGQWVNTTCN